MHKNKCSKICKNGKKCKKCSFKGEKHMIGRNKKGKIVKMNFCGPGTNLKARSKGKCSKPISKVDSVCKTHDYAYLKIGKAKVSKNKKKKQVRKADINMIKSLKSIKGLESKIASKTIKGKIKLEKLGLLNRLKFISKPN